SVAAVLFSRQGPCPPVRGRISLGGRPSVGSPCEQVGGVSVTLAVRHGRASGIDGTDPTARATARTAPAAPGRVESDRTPVGFAIGLGALAVIVAAFVAAAILAGHPGWRFAVMAVVVGLFAAISLDQVAVAAVAVITALVTNGFIEDRAGQ